MYDHSARSSLIDALKHGFFCLRCEGRARRNIGRNWLLEGDAAAALRILTQALDEATKTSDRPARAECLASIGQTLVAQRHPRDAVPLLLQAVEIHRSIGDRAMEAMDLHILGTAWAALSDTAQAREYFAQAYNLRHDIGLRDASVDSLAALADIERTAGNKPAAVDFATQALSSMESVRIQVPGPELRASYFARRRKLFDLLVALAAPDNSSPSGEAAFLAAERGRGRALIDLLAEGDIVSAVPPSAASQRTNIEHRIDLLALRLSTASPAAAEPLHRQVEVLAASREEIEAEIREGVAQRKVTTPLSSVAEVRDALPSDTAIVEYYLGENESYLWVIRKGDETRFFRLPARSEIEAECRPVLKLFPLASERKNYPKMQQTFDAALQRLSGTLLGPLADLELPDRLVLVPDGALNSIPFSALPLSRSRRLGLSFDLVQTTSAAYITVGRKPRNPFDFSKAFLALSDPVFSPKDPRVHNVQAASIESSFPSLSRLPVTADTDAAASILPASKRRVLRGFEANPEALTAAVSGDYAIIHLSAHGIIDDRTPELSRIVLSLVGPSGVKRTGLLRPSEFASLHLSGSTVVLSACDSALGKPVEGEGLEGFTASLFHAGAAQLVLSLSAVDAEGSSALLAEVYRNVLGPRRTSAEHGITLARRSLARSPRWSDPWYWASFAVYGRPAETLR